MEEKRSVYRAVASERAVLGALMIGAARVDEVPLRGGDFTGMVERTIFETMLRLRTQGMGHALVDVSDALPEIDANLLVEISTDACNAFELESTVRAIRAASIRRGLLKQAQELMLATRDPARDPNAMLDDCLSTLANMQSMSVENEGVDMQSAVLRTHEMLFDRPPQRILTGIGAYDRLTGGISEGQLCVIGARPSVGKSAFALTVAMHAARAGKRILLVSLEMGEEEITRRMLAFSSGMPMGAIQAGQMSERVMRSVVEHEGVISTLPITLDTQSRTPAQVRRMAMRLRQQKGLDMVIIDYLQLMQSGRRAQNRAEEVGQISRALKEMAMDLKMPVVALAQLNRDSQKLNRQPSMADLRESGNVEQDADQITLLHRVTESNIPCGWAEALRTCENRGTRLVSLIVDKNRNGKIGMVPCEFDGAQMRFTAFEREGGR